MKYEQLIRDAMTRPKAQGLNVHPFRAAAKRARLADLACELGEKRAEIRHLGDAIHELEQDRTGASVGPLGALRSALEFLVNGPALD